MIGKRVRLVHTGIEVEVVEETPDGMLLVYFDGQPRARRIARSQVVVQRQAPAAPAHRRKK